MDDRFFQRPILNTAYGCPSLHWELDAQGRKGKGLCTVQQRCDHTVTINAVRAYVDA